MRGPHFCGMRITEDVRKFAVEHGLTDAEAIESGMQEKRNVSPKGEDAGVAESIHEGRLREFTRSRKL